MLKYSKCHKESMIIAILGSDHINSSKCIKAIENLVLDEKIKPEDTIIISDGTGVSAIVRSMGLSANSNRICKLDKSLGESAKKEQREVLIKTADRIFLIWDGKEEFSKTTLTILKTGKKIYEEIKIDEDVGIKVGYGDDGFQQAFKKLADLRTEMSGWRAKLDDINAILRKLEAEK